MHDELTKVDIKKMQEEIDYRINVLTPKLKDELSKARAKGTRPQLQPHQLPAEDDSDCRSCFHR